MRRLLSALLLLLPAASSADFQHPQPGEVAVRAVPGSDEQWQEARTVVDAPAEAVRRWLTEYEYWPGRFRDVKETRVLARNGEAARVWVRSEIMRELVLDIRETPAGIVYQTNDGNVHARGRILITSLDDGRTDVRMQTTANLSGFLGAITPKSLIRSRERDKLVSDLSDLQRLARHRSARRPPPAWSPSRAQSR